MSNSNLVQYIFSSIKLHLKTNVKLIVSVSAIFIATLSLIVSIFDSYENRRFKRLTMEPVVNISLGWDREKGFWLRAINVGRGPAIVKWFQVLVDEKPVQHWDAFLYRLGAADPLGVLPRFRFSMIYEGSTMQPTDSTNDWENKTFLFNLKDEESSLILGKRYEDITTKICYCSIYEDCWLRDSTAKDPVENSCRDRPEIVLEMPPSFASKN